MPARRRRAVPAEIRFDAFLTLQRGGRDAERYFAYANALLGRPYAGQYVLLTEDAKGAATALSDRLVQPARPLLPWRDFFVEYPPGMLVPAVVPALFTSNFETYFLLFCIEMEAMLTVAVALAVRTADGLTPGAGRRALSLSIVLTLALGCIAVRRYDASVALTIAAAVYGMAKRRPVFAAVSLALGVALKGAPLLMAPVMLFWFAARRDWRGLALGAASGTLCLAAVGLAYLSIAGPHAMDAFAYHADRPLQLETPYGGALMLLEPFVSNLVSATYGYGSHNVASPAEPWLRRAADAIEIAALLAVYAAAYVRIRSRPGRPKSPRRRGLGRRRLLRRIHERRQGVQPPISRLAIASRRDRRRRDSWPIVAATGGRQRADASGLSISVRLRPERLSGDGAAPWERSS